jgi:hypothetical protein
MVVVSATSCRSHAPLCRGIACEEAFLAGAGPGEPSVAGEAGQAGAPAEAVAAHECSRAAECSNARVCDGVESCEDGQCVAGEALVCLHEEMHCEEDTDERCVFNTPSPWLVVARGETLEGLPTSRLGKEANLIVLAARQRSRGFGFALALFGSSGPFALSVAAEEEGLDSVRYLRFGRGLPSELRLLPDVPDLLESWELPLISPDSRFALLLDKASGNYLASLEDPRQPTLRFERTPYADEPSFCQEPATFWHDSATTLTIVSRTADGVESRSIEASSLPAFSWERRYIVAETDEPAGVIVTRCSVAGTNTLYEDASSPVIAPGSRAVLMNAANGMKLYSLDDPDARVELWSSSLQLAFPCFSSDGAHLVGSVDGTHYVAALNDPSRPAEAFGLPANASFVSFLPDGRRDRQYLIGKSAALVWVPAEDGVGRELVWQPLNPSRERESLLVDPDSSHVDVLVSQHDVDQAFIVSKDAVLQHLKRVRLDAEQPELEDLFALDTDIRVVELAPDGSGLAVRGLDGIVSSKLYWAGLGRNGKLQAPLMIADKVINFSFQPWR